MYLYIGKSAGDHGIDHIMCWVVRTSALKVLIKAVGEIYNVMMENNKKKRKARSTEWSSTYFVCLHVHIAYVV